MPSLKRLILVSFPRSGSFFVTQCMSCYFGERIKYLEPYANTSIIPIPKVKQRLWGARFINENYFSKNMNSSKTDKSKSYLFSEANLIRFHDFTSFPQRTVYMPEDVINIEKKYSLDNIKNRDNSCYLILIRHPIESIQSYYEFSVRNSGFHDSIETWNVFYKHTLDYWTSFVDKWILNTNDYLIKNKTVVLYEDLATNTELALSRIVSCYDYKKLNKKLIKKIAKLRYSSSRNIADFKYFDAKSFEDIQEKLHDSYLRPLGITPYVNFTKSYFYYDNSLLGKMINKIIS